MNKDPNRLERIERLIQEYNRFGRKKDKLRVLKNLKSELNDNLKSMKKSKEV